MGAVTLEGKANQTYIAIRATITTLLTISHSLTSRWFPLVRALNLLGIGLMAAPHVGQAKSSARVVLPQYRQKVYAFTGLAPQAAQVLSGVTTSSLPQFLQNNNIRYSFDLSPLIIPLVPYLIWSGNPVYFPPCHSGVGQNPPQFLSPCRRDVSEGESKLHCCHSQPPAPT